MTNETIITKNKKTLYETDLAHEQDRTEIRTLRKDKEIL